MRKEPHHTKAGPGRVHAQGDGSKTRKQLSAGAYGRGLRNNITRKQAAAQAAKTH